jgi:hypothetical protein
VREAGEACDGSDDGDCPGACDANCACPTPCTQGDLQNIKRRVDVQRLRFRSLLTSFQGAFHGKDPRDGFTLELTQGANLVTVDVPPGDPGWADSQPAKGRYKWRGDLNGVSRIKAIDRTARNGTWKIIVIGSDVPGTGGFDDEQPIDIELTVDGACTEETF